MPLTVITLTNAPPSLRGDLTKWMQEIAIGVYVGNVNTKIREQLWERVIQNIRHGQATMTFSNRNEVGYQFQTLNAYRQNIDFDGIPLVLIPSNSSDSDKNNNSHGYSNAYKFLKAKKFSNPYPNDGKEDVKFVVMDIETDGLDVNTNSIIEIGAIKISGDRYETYNCMIKSKKRLPDAITKLTGITGKMLQSDGIDIYQALKEFISFVGDYPLIGYSVNFDISFINENLRKADLPILTNLRYDLLRFVKKEKMFLKDYHLSTVLNEYKINKQVPHRALADAELIYELAKKVNGFLNILKER